MPANDPQKKIHHATQWVDFRISVFKTPTPLLKDHDSPTI